jgi:hypothetical protein
MSRLTPENQSRVPYAPDDDWRRYGGVAERRRSGGPGLLLTGLIVVGLGALAWNYFGPDLRRYLKIRSM